MPNTTVKQKRRRRSRYRFSDIPDLTQSLSRRRDSEDALNTSDRPMLQREHSNDRTLSIPRDELHQAARDSSLSTLRNTTLNSSKDASTFAEIVPNVASINAASAVFNSSCNEVRPTTQDDIPLAPQDSILESPEPSPDQFSRQTGQDALPMPTRTRRSGSSNEEEVLGLAVFREAVMASPASPIEDYSENFIDGDILSGDDTEEEAHVLSTRSPVHIRLSNWRVIWGLLRTNGSQKLTKEIYQSVRNLVRAVSRLESSSWRDQSIEFGRSNEVQLSLLPHFSTLHKNYRPIVMKELAPRSLDRLVDVDISKAGARAKRLTENETPQSLVRIILPSEYARADIGTPPVWEELKSTTLAAHGQSDSVPSISTVECVDLWPIIAAREWFYGPQSSLHLDCEGASSGHTSFAETGDIVTTTLVNPPSEILEHLQRSFLRMNGQSQFDNIQGSVVHSWTVHHCSRRSDPNFSDKALLSLSKRDQNIAEIFNIVSYTSPSDCGSVTIPELPVPTEDVSTDGDGFRSINSTRNPTVLPDVAEAMKRSRAALKLQKNQMEAAWRDWVKPALKPGDFVTMIRPCALQSTSGSTLLTDVDRFSRLLLVSRFWVENEERTFHMVWISGSTQLDIDVSHMSSDEALIRSYCTALSDIEPSSILLDIRQIALLRAQDGQRGTAKFTPVSSIGILSSGEDYFVYRFALYWDGFEVQTGKSATGEGFYLICLNLPLASRSSPSAVRILSLTPPGVKADEILSAIFDDVIAGMTTGFADYDADGNRRRIFLDLVAFLGDTPALNSFLDVLGHTASACCHLCNFVRGSPTLVGSRYAAGSGHGMVSHSMRTYFQHTAVRDCGAGTETCRLLGIKHFLSPTARVFLSLRDRMLNARGAISRTSDGHPVVPHFIDPYRACFIAPDHLLTGHFRDCLSLVLRLLPSDKHRKACEMFMMGFLVDAGLPIQNRLVDHSKKSLFAMSMSELYALSIVADTALDAACRFARESMDAIQPLSEKCKEAILLVRSCAILISELWQHPRLHIDGYNSVQRFEHSNGATNIFRLQKLTNDHLDKVASICHMSNMDVLQLNDSRCPKQKKLELSRLLRDTMTSVKTVDKPNVRRLREMAHTTLSLVGHIGRVGELVLEKTHQSLKRAIKLSNNKDIHLHAMSGAAFNDWQGRLSMLVKTAIDGNDRSIFGCFRLLAGRKAVETLKGILTPVLSDDVLRALGPDQCLVVELQAQGKRVLAPRAPSTSDGLIWSIKSPLRVADDTGSLLSSKQRRTMHFLQNAHPGDLRRFEIHIGAAASSVDSEKVHSVSLRNGDVMEVLLYHPDCAALHFPFLVQPNCISTVPDWSSRTGPSIWFIQNFVSLKPSVGSTIFYAAVLPCVPVRRDTVTMEFNPRFPEYRACTDANLSFAMLEDGIRRVGVLHNCYNNACRPTPGGIHLSHTPELDPGEGGHFCALTRTHGYPPRKG